MLDLQTSEQVEQILTFFFYLEAEKKWFENSVVYLHLSKKTANDTFSSPFIE